MFEFDPRHNLLLFEKLQTVLSETPLLESGFLMVVSLNVLKIYFTEKFNHYCILTTNKTS